MALRGRPGDAGLMNNLAWVYAEIGDTRALAAAQRGYLFAPDADAGDTLGWIMVRQNAASDAVTILQGAVSQRPGDPTMAYHFAVALNRTGQAAEASRLLKLALASSTAFDDRAAATGLAR